MQWLNTVIPVVHANFQGLPLEGASMLANHERATWLALVGTVATAIGMRLALRHRLGSFAGQIETELSQLNLRRAFLAYLGGYALASICGVLAWRLGGLAQLILAAGLIKWSLLWLLVTGSFVQRTGNGYILLALALEASVGFLGYFSTFKEGFFVLGLAVLTVRRPLAPETKTMLGLAGVCLLAMLVFWQAIKKDYRMFVSDGMTDQAVRVSVEARLAKLRDLALNLNLEAVDTGIITLIERVGYTDLFAATLNWVPAYEPHAGGALSKRTILHPLMPRLLFPDKAAINDSELARQYTGLNLSGSEEGTSIGIGYFAESYVDFGAVGMFAPLLLLGYALGWIYRTLCGVSETRAWGVALAIAVLFVMLVGIATAGAKLLGSMVTSSIVLAAVHWIAGPPVIRWLGLAKRTPSPTHNH